MNTNINIIFNLIAEEFIDSKNDQRSIEMAAYMKNNFLFYGVPSPLRKEIQKKFYKNLILNKNEFLLFAQKGFSFPQREMHYFTIDFIAKQKNISCLNQLEFFEYLIKTNSWWDSVDTICSKISSPFLLKNEKEKKTWIKKWSKDENLWLRRASIIAQLKMKADTDLELLTFVIENNLNSKEFFIDKAIGWALREFAKTNKEWVIEYVSKTNLSNLSKREALKHFI